MKNMRYIDPMKETPIGKLLGEVRLLKAKVEGKDKNLADNYPPYDKVTRGDVIAAVTGKKGKVKSKPKKDEAGSYKSDRGEKIGKGSDDDKMGCKGGMCKDDDCPTCGVKKGYGDKEADVMNSSTRFMDISGGEQVHSVGGYQGNQSIPFTTDGSSRSPISETANIPSVAQTGYDTSSSSLHMHLNDGGSKIGPFSSVAKVEESLGSIKKNATHGQMGIVDEIGDLLEKVYARL